jgi:lipopolysaccharide transport system ATP-binding protein
MEMKAVEEKRKAAGKPAIVVKNVTKEFIIPHERRTTLFENIKGLFQSSTYEKFTALKDVSFTVERGESVGIIGDNGSGKSTLLKIVSRILRPTSGSVEVNGRITPFLELGVGFQPDLTARENIEVYSTIMGLSDKEIARNIDSVLEFAGLTRFRDTKLKNFSSGMQVRLAFATAIQREPDILLVDEVLAVGDMDFQQKCLDTFAEYKKKGITMLFVSHDMGSVMRFCDKTVLLRSGELLACGKTGDIIDRYVYGIDKAEALPEIADNPSQQDNAQLERPAGEQVPMKKDRWGNQKLIITDVGLLDKFGRPSDRFNTNDSMTIRMSYYAKELISDPVFGVSIHNENGLLYYGTNTDVQGLSLGKIDGEGILEIGIRSLSLLAGKYFLTVAAHTKDHIPYDWHDKKYTFTVTNTGRVSGIFDLKGEWVHGR